MLEVGWLAVGLFLGFWLGLVIGCYLYARSTSDRLRALIASDDARQREFEELLDDIHRLPEHLRPHFRASWDRNETGYRAMEDRSS